MTESYARRLVIAGTAVVLLQILITIAAQTHLAGDGSAFLYWLMTDPRTMTWAPDRRVAHLITQFPIVLAIRGGVTDVGVLSRILGVGFYFPILASLFACLWIAKRDMKFMLFPLLSFAAFLSSGSFYIVSEAHALAAMFWPLLFLLLLRAEWKEDEWVTAILFALPTLFIYESMLLMGPILGAVAAWRVLCARGKERIGFAALAGWFVLGALVALRYTLKPRDPKQMRDFASNSGLGVFTDGAGHLHWMALLGVAAISIVVAALFLSKWRGRRVSVVIILFGVACLVAALIPLYAPEAVHLEHHRRARALDAFGPPLLGLIMIAALWKPPALERWRPALVATLIIVAAQMSWNSFAAKRWSAYLGVFRNDIAFRSGFVPYRESVVSSDEWKDLTLWWTMPIMSILLSPNHDVRALVGEERPGEWQPFDPQRPEKIRDLSRYGFRFDKYRAALTR